MNYELTNLPDTKEYKLEGMPDTIPELKQAPDPTLSERVFKFFSGADDSDVAAAQLALVDSNRLGISASAAYDHRYAIDAQIKADPKQYSLRSTMKDRLDQSFKTGIDNNRRSEMLYQWIFTKDKKLFDEARAIITPTQAETFLPQNRLENNMMSAAGMVPAMWEGLKEGGVKGGLLGTIMGLGGILMGQPEAAPALFKAGIMVGGAEGIFESAMRKESGSFVNEMFNLTDDEGNPLNLNEDIIRAVALPMGIVSGIIETAQFKSILKTIPGANKIFSQAIEKTLKSRLVKDQLLSLGKKYAGTLAENVGEEVAQQADAILFRTLATEINNATEGTDIPLPSVKGIFDELVLTAKESSKGLSLITAIGPVMSLAGVRSVKQQDTAMARETVNQTTGKFNGVVLNDEGKAESISVIDPQTGDNLSFDINTTPEEINQTIETVRNERVQASEGILDDIITGSNEITDDNIGEVIDTLDIKINENITPLFSESNRLTNINKEGNTWTAIKNENPGLDINKPITIYRATIGDKIRVNDFVAINKDIADSHLENLNDRGENGKIITQIVDASDLLMGNDATEFVYYPAKNVQMEGEKPIVKFMGYQDPLMTGQPQPVYEVTSSPDPNKWAVGSTLTVRGLQEQGIEIPAINLDNKVETAPIFESLNQNIETPENAIDQIETLGKAVLNEGIIEQQPFMNRMRVILGDLWESFKDVVMNVWNKLKEERGSISFEDIGINFRDWVVKTGGLNPNDKDYGTYFKELAKGEKGTAKGWNNAIWNKDAIGVDERVTQAIEHGWLPEGSTEQDFVDMLISNPSKEQKVSEVVSGNIDVDIDAENEYNWTLWEAQNEGYTREDIEQIEREQDKAFRAEAERHSLTEKELNRIFKPSEQVIKKPSEVKASKKSTKGIIRETTGQVKPDAQVSEREALKGSIKKQEKVSKQIYKEGVKVGKEQSLAPKPETVKGRIARTTGIKQISNMIREDEVLKAAFTKAMQAARKAFREGDKEGVAKQKQHMREILENAKQREVKRQLISEISNITKKAVNSNIAIDYKKKITALMDAFDSKKLTDDKKAALESLAKYVKENGIPLGINPKRIQELERLSKKPLSEMTVSELTTLKENLKMLKALGKLKAKLSKFADKRERERKVNALIAGSKNLDGEKLKNKDVSRIVKTGNAFKEGIKDFYLETLHTPRVADMIDGFKRYMGLNAKMIKDQTLAEQIANKETINRINKLIDKLEKANVLKDITEEQQIRIMIHLRYQEGAYDAVQSLLDFYGFDIPAGEIINDKNPLTNYVKLSKDEQQIINSIREIVNEKKYDIASLHEELTNNIFEFIDNYTLPLMYEKSEIDTPDDIIRHDFDDTDNVGNPVFRTKKTFQGFTISRKPGVTKVPRVDIFNIFETAISAQEWYLNMQPVLIDHASLVYDKEYVKSVGEVVSNWWKDQIHIVAQRGWKASHTYTGIDRGLRAARHNLNRGVLLYKVTTILMQPFAVIDAIAFTMNKYGLIAAARVGKEVTKSLLNWRYAQDIIDTSTALQQRKGGEVAMEEILKELSTKDRIFNNIEKVGYWLIQKPDILTASGVRQGVYNTLIDQGLSESDAGNEADFIMNMTQGSSNVTLRPHILALGEGYRTLFTFQSFFMNRWGIMVHDLITTGAKGNFKAKLYALMGLGIFVMGGLGEDEARRRLTNLLRKKEIKSDASLIKEVLLSVLETAPLLGNMVKSVRHGYDSDSPLGRAGKQFVKGFYYIGTGKVGKGSMELSESILSAGIGIPGVSQLFDVFEYMLEDEKGRQ